MFWSLNFSTTLPSSYPSGKPTFTRLGGSARTLGNRKRRVPSVIRPRAAPIVVQARANHEPTRAVRKLRRSSPFFAAGLAGGFAAAGLAAGGLTGAVAVAVLPGAGAAEVGLSAGGV